MPVKTAVSQLEDAYSFFRLDRQSVPVSPATLRTYDFHVQPFLRWLKTNHPQVAAVGDVDVNHLRAYRAELVQRPGLMGRTMQPESMAGIDTSIRTFFRWALDEGYEVQPRILTLRRVRVPWKEPTIFHLKQLREILLACNEDLPHEALAVKLLVGAGLRRAELGGLALRAPDGLSDLMLDSIDRGIAELRVRGDGGAKGMKTRRVPITTRLALEMKRYAARLRPRSDDPHLLLNRNGQQYGDLGINELMVRLSTRAGYRIHAHAFRHTFATVATQLGWNFERLRSAMGHADYTTLQRYVRLSMERDLGRLEDWLEFVALPPQPQIVPAQAFGRRRVS